MNKRSILILGIIVLILVSFSLGTAQKSPVSPNQQATPLADSVSMYLHAHDGLFQNLNFHLENLHIYAEQGLIDLDEPISTYWYEHDSYPHESQRYHLTSWEDNGDSVLSPCDQIDLEHIGTGQVHPYHVKEVTFTLFGLAVYPARPTYLEYTAGCDPAILQDPTCTWWHEVWPNFGKWHRVSGWWDDGTGSLDSLDLLFLTGMVEDVPLFLVWGVATNIMLKREPLDPLGTQWHQLFPYYSQRYQLTSWEDNGDGVLSPSDQIDMVLKDEEGNPTTDTSWYHIDSVTTTIFVVEKTPREEQEFVRGDVNQDGIIDNADIIACVMGGPFFCDDAVDVNDDGILDMADCDYLSDFLYTGGPPPLPPYPGCCVDWTPDDNLGCASFPLCPGGTYDLTGNTMVLEYLGMSDTLLTEPEFTIWHEKYPVYCSTYQLSYWEDDGDGFLSISDQIYLANTQTGLEGHYHVYEICIDLHLTRKPISTQWHDLYPVNRFWYQVDDWFDNGSGVLDYCDWLALRNEFTQEVDIVHVENKTVTLILESLDTGDTMAVEWLYEGEENPLILLLNPVCNNLHEIWPVFCRNHHLSSWSDNGDGFLSVCDTIDIEDLETHDITYWHVIDVATDIVVRIENRSPAIIQPDTLYGYTDCDTVIYTFDGIDADGDPILDDASLVMEPSCGTYWVNRLTGHGTSQGTWKVTWETAGCEDSITYRIIVDLTDDQGNTSWCTTYCHLADNLEPHIDQPAFLEGYVDSVVKYTITGTDPEGDVIQDSAFIDIQPGCGSGYSITRISGQGTSSGTWEITWYTDGCTACDTHEVTHSLTDICGNSSSCTTAVHLWDYRGDVNGDGIVNSADVVFLIDYLFKGGPAPDPLSEGDVNCDDIVNSADVVFLINYLFKGGPPPRCCAP